VDMELKRLIDKARSASKKPPVRLLRKPAPDEMVDAFANVICFGCREIQHSLIVDHRVHQRLYSEYLQFISQAEAYTGKRLLREPENRSVDIARENNHSPS
jgi:hypothetical protein